jgi:hypothetical protein
MMQQVWSFFSQLLASQDNTSSENTSTTESTSTTKSTSAENTSTAESHDQIHNFNSFKEATSNMDDEHISDYNEIMMIINLLEYFQGVLKYLQSCKLPSTTFTENFSNFTVDDGELRIATKCVSITPCGIHK